MNPETAAVGAPSHGTRRRRPRLLATVVFYSLYLGPAVSVASLNVGYAYWLASSAALATAVRWLWAGSVVNRCAALALNATASFANVLLMISLHVQGAGFNPQFFFHVSWETLLIAKDVFAPMFFGCWAYWLLVSAWPGLLPRPADQPPRRGRHIAVALALGLALNAPLLSFGWHLAKESIDVRRALLVPKPSPHLALGTQSARKAPDLILIFAEALEATLSERWAFGADMTPRLSALADEGMQFTNMHEVSYASWTAAALVAAQCGVPLRPDALFERALGRLSFDALMPGATCLGDVLSANGYATAFMGGASLAFSGKGTFLAEHGFARRHGRVSLTARLPDPSYVSEWGIFDDSLFALALDELAALDADSAPFALALLTLDTHSPAGFPSASCARLGTGGDAGQPTDSAPALSEAQRAMLRTVQCSDRLLADFIQQARARYPNALIAMFSDHEVPFNNVLARPLAQRQAERRLRFVVWGPDIAPGEVVRPGTHFDVMPTLMDLLGFPAWAEHNLGASLMRFDSPWFSQESPYALRVTHHLTGVGLASNHAVTFDADGPLIEFDGTSMLATNQGLRLTDGAFALALDGQGNVAGMAHFPNRAGGAPDATLREWAQGRALVGISNNQAINRLLASGAPPGMMFFAGRLDSETLVAGELAARHTVAVPMKP